jgi:hypothetical protein
MRQREFQTYLASENASVEPDITTDVDQFDVCGNFLTHSDMYEITGNKHRSWYSNLLAVTEHDDVRGEHALDGGHHSRRGKVLPRIEDCLQHDDDEENDRERKVRRLWGRFT